MSEKRVVKRIFFLAEMANGEQYIMNLEGEECYATAGIAWAPLENNKHPWEDLYETKAIADPKNAKDYLKRAQIIRDSMPLPIPKPYNCMPMPPTKLLKLLKRIPK